MGKREKQDLTTRPARANSDPQKSERRFQWWQLLIGSVVVLLAASIPQLWNTCTESSPRFILENPVLRPETPVMILAQNRAANRNAPLNVEFDGLMFASAGEVIPKRKPRCWKFVLEGRYAPDSLLEDGPHQMRVNFAGEEPSAVMKLCFTSKAPVVSMDVIQPEDNPQERQFVGRAASSFSETLAVDIAFHSQGKPIEVPVAVKRITDVGSGATYFEFETTVQGLPQILSSDPRYAEPFFAIRVTDQAGNQYYQQESYAQFMAPGDKRFGVTNFAGIDVKRLPPDVRGNTKLTFRLAPEAKRISRLPSGEPAMMLKVTSLAQDLHQLEWTSLPENVRAAQPVTVVLRDDKPIGTSLSNEYVDEQAPARRETSYRVEQTGDDGNVYVSNTAIVASGKEPPPETFLSIEAAQAMLRRNGLFDRNLNPSGNGITHQYEIVERNGENLVIDHATGLTWQQSGSLYLSDPTEYVRSLNQKSFAGYSDWRLPRLEEAMALMKPKKRGTLYIDAVFDRQQRWIWTLDKESISSTWYVDFESGLCDLGPADAVSLVRAVR